ncbi:MAG TPA: hypothetical protein VEC75_10480 [Stellaceae bacterium]|nr:hypothetical protein [Stellaceae bacterium]
MGLRTAAVAASMALFASAAFLPTGAARAQQSQTHPIPQSIRLDHEEAIRQLTAVAHRKGRTGEIARKALEVFKAHIRREEEYILPPLTLAPAIAEGRINPDMRWAIAMADRIKADREIIFAEHTTITAWMNQLAEAARRAHQEDVVDLAKSLVADSLNDTEVMEPAAIVIGEYLRAKLPPAQ